ncbi:MAG: S1 RNA-binding domain-containing protein [Kiritimatiellia bacterium]|jgi:small subunit ribosomal protein S1
MADFSDRKASMADFEALLNAQLDSYRKGFDPGERVKGVVISTKGEYVVLDVNAKNEGLVPAAELLDSDGDLMVTPGQEIEVIFSRVDGGAFLFTTRIADAVAADRSIQAAREAGLPVEGLVKAEINGGYEIEVDGQRGFCPFSQIDLFKREGAVYVGQRLPFLVVEYDPEEKNLVLSRRQLLERDREAQREALLAQLAEGQMREGTVTRLVDFGLFVDLGGIEGLVPLKEISWDRNAKPGDVADVGDRVQVLVREIDAGRNRISLSLRGVTADPWDGVVARHPVGSSFIGKVVHLEPFGAFVQVEPGVEGLVAIGKLGSGRRLSHPREAVAVGQELLVQVETVDVERRRIGLRPVDERVASLRPGALEPGVEVEGIVEGIRDFGVFVRLSETQTGLLHIAETDVGRRGNPSALLERAFEPGSKLKVVVKENDGQRISLTLPSRWNASRNTDEADTAAFLANQRSSSESFGSLSGAFDSLGL